MGRSIFHLTGWLVVASLLPTNAYAQLSSFEHPPIDYLNAKVNDAVIQLDRQIQSGQIELSYDEKFGYLKSLLEKLDVPVESQTLVFSKTSLQLHRISPRRPRSVYFNDEVYVGYCQQGDVLELSVTDPKQGAIFYTLSQEKTAKPTFVRDRGQCLTCHASSRTQNVPGYLVRSVFADAAGRPKLGSGTFTTDHTSDFKDRWGGWYVTGKHGDMRHMGNAICRDSERTFDREAGANKTDITEFFRSENFLTPHSDLVALMVMEHQTQMHNAIAAANYETRQALHQSYQMNELLEREPGHISESANRRINAAADRVIRYLLMCDEFELTSPVEGTSGFREGFEQRGIKTAKGKSLRQLNLQTRLFEFPCSYMIHSDAYTALPDEVRDRINHRLLKILRGEDTDPKFDHLTATMRQDILHILRATQPELNGLTLTSQQDRAEVAR